MKIFLRHVALLLCLSGIILLSPWVATASYMDPARFYVVEADGDEDNSVTLSVTGDIGNVQYSTDHKNWTDIAGKYVVFDFTNLGKDMLLTYWRMGSDEGANLEFSVAQTMLDGVQLYKKVSIYWNDDDLTKATIEFTSGQDKDGIMAAVPIPSAAILLASAVVGLLCIGRLRVKKPE